MLYRKDFEIIAKIISQARQNPNLATVDGHCKQITEDLANYLETKNPEFDRDKFLKACGVKT